MSTIEKNFLKWFAGIASLLIVAAVIGLFNSYRSDGVMEQRVTGIEEQHKTDVGYIREDIKEIKASQLITQGDIKKLLEKK